MSELIKKIKNGRLFKNNGSWMYCDKCNKTVGYLVYSTYQDFAFEFVCKCGNEGSFELSHGIDKAVGTSSQPLKQIKNRLCCSNDDAPLFSVVDKNVESYSCVVTCSKCSLDTNPLFISIRWIIVTFLSLPSSSSGVQIQSLYIL